MKYQVNINKVRSADEIQAYWSEDDYRKLLDLLEVSDIDQIDGAELREYLFMAMTDVEAHEAAKIVLTYKLEELLTEGQIDQLSHDMQKDKVAEEYPDISLHATLFHVNQLLHKAFAGTFPATKASIIDVEVHSSGKEEATVLTKPMMLKVLQHGWKESNIIKRLFGEQLLGKLSFSEAEHILWELHATDHTHYQLITSDYWLNRDDFTQLTFTGEVARTE